MSEKYAPEPPKTLNTLLIRDLAECYRLTGADPDGNEDWRLAQSAVAEVRRLRAEYDQAEASLTALVAALKHSEQAFASLPVDALGMGHDDHCEWPLRDELLTQVRAALQLVEGHQP